MKKTTFLLLLSWLSLFAATAQKNIQIKHQPYLQDMDSSEVTIVWIADQPSVGWVELAPDDGSHFYQQERPRYYDTRNGIKRVDSIHFVTLKNLEPGRAYRYRVYAQEVLQQQSNRVFYGDVAATAVYKQAPLRFVTNNPAKQSLSFLMVNDIHDRSDLLDELLDVSDPATKDLVLFNGDMVSFLNSQDALFDGFMDCATRRFASEVPMYYCRGNHETRGEKAPDFQRYFMPGSDKLYTAFRQGPACFVILDGGEDKPDSDIEYAGINCYDDYRSEQARWLESVLNSDLYRDAPFKRVICHMPPFGDWHGSRELFEKFVPLLNDAKPDLMLSGHLHQKQIHPASAEVHFPVIINSNNDVLEGEIIGNELKIKIKDRSGKQEDEYVVKH